MTEEQVTAILGKPNGVTGFGDGTAWRCHYRDYGVHIMFVDGIVTTFGYYRRVDEPVAREESR